MLKLNESFRILFNKYLVRLEEIDGSLFLNKYKNIKDDL